jgi:hypothetical protein
VSIVGKVVALGIGGENAALNIARIMLNCFAEER